MKSKGLLSFVLGVVTFIACMFWRDQEPRNTILKISIGFVVGGIIEFIAYLIDNRKKWKLLTTLVINRNKRIRVTIAYLYRIEVNGEYVLIKRHKKDRPGFQPVGGAYKYLKEESREVFDKLGVMPCNYVTRDEDTENDLRVIVNKRKNLIAFLKWFESRKNREIDPLREFYEELVAPGYLDSEVFKHIKYVFVSKHEEGPLPASAFPVDEYRYAEIYDLRLETDEQKKAIPQLKKLQNEILFATPEEIKNGVSKDGKPILPHTFKILPK